VRDVQATAPSPGRVLASLGIDELLNGRTGDRTEECLD
jgi:hypothetical protein